MNYSGTNFADLVTVYELILDRAINRPAFNPDDFPNQPNYQPLPNPFDLAGAQTDWKSAILPEAGGISKGIVLVGFPESLQLLAEALCEMWDQVEPNLHYQPIPIPDAEFVATLLDVLTNQSTDGGMPLLIVSTESMAQDVVNKYPQDFTMQQFMPI